MLQREVAEQLGVKLPTYQSWEAGHEPTVCFWPMIIAWLGYFPGPEPITRAAKLIAYRRRSGLSQSVLAKQLGVDPGSLRRWERGCAIRKQSDQEAVATLLDASEID